MKAAGAVDKRSRFYRLNLMMKSRLKSLAGKFVIIGGLFRYLWNNKMWWLTPLVAVLVILGAIIIIGQSTPLGAFIYTIF